jgi:hypothetical protein
MMVHPFGFSFGFRVGRKGVEDFIAGVHWRLREGWL